MTSRLTLWQKIVRNLIFGTPKTSRRKRKNQPATPARVERLEDRLLLSTFHVNRTDDTVDISPGNGVARDGTGATTLRAAIMEANALRGADTIVLPAGTFVLSRAGAGENAAVDGDLDVTDLTGSLKIIGAGAGQTIIDAARLDRVFHVLPGASLTLEGLTITGGSAKGNSIQDERGGGVYVDGGTLVVANSIVSENFAPANTNNASGGGISNANSGSVTIINSTLTGNSAFSQGGGIYINGSGSNVTITQSTLSENEGSNGGGIANIGGGIVITDSTLFGNMSPIGAALYNTVSGTAEITDSTFYENSSNIYGGAIYNLGSAHIEITNSTLSGNSARRDAGAIFNRIDGTVNISNSTLTGNRANSDGDSVGSGGALFIDSDAGPVTLHNTIVAGNLRGTGTLADEIAGTLANASSFNLIADAGTAGGLLDGSNGNIVQTIPTSGILDVSLADNGGPTLTHALVAGSQAIDAGDPNFDGTNLPYDQRRAGFPRIIGGRIDIGAFERLNTATTAAAGGPYVVDEGTSLTLDGSGSTDAQEPTGALTFEWDLGYDGATFNVDVTGIAPTVSFPDDFSTRTIALRVTDSDGASDLATTTLTVNNVVPTLVLNPVSAIDENGMATLTGTISDPGTQDSFTFDIDWGDPLSPGNVETYTFNSSPTGTQSFSISHRYLDDNPSETASDTYTVNASVTDGALVPGVVFESATTGGSGSPRRLGISSNQFLGVRFEVTETSTITGIGLNQMNGSGQIFGAIVALSSATDFPDSSSLTTSDVVNSALISVGVQQGEYSSNLSSVLEPGWYAVLFGSGLFGATGWGEAPGNDTDIGTPSYLFRDGAGTYFNGTDRLRYFVEGLVESPGVSTSTTITVNNVSPTPTITGVPTIPNEADTISLGSTIIDPGTLDTHTLGWSVTKDGNPYASGSGTTFDFTPDDNGTYVVTLTATDDDGGVGTATETIEVANVAPTLNDLTLSETNINEGDSTTLAGTISDPGTEDTFTIEIDWDGDGTVDETHTGVRAAGAFNYAHTYLDDDPSATPSDTYDVGINVTDDDGGHVQSGRYSGLGQTAIVSVDSQENQANNDAVNSSISADGRFVVFESRMRRTWSALITTTRPTCSFMTPRPGRPSESRLIPPEMRRTAAPSVRRFQPTADLLPSCRQRAISSPATRMANGTFSFMTDRRAKPSACRSTRRETSRTLLPAPRTDRQSPPMAALWHSARLPPIWLLATPTMPQMFSSTIGRRDRRSGSRSIRRESKRTARRHRCRFRRTAGSSRSTRLRPTSWLTIPMVSVTCSFMTATPGKSNASPSIQQASKQIAAHPLLQFPLTAALWRSVPRRATLWQATTNGAGDIFVRNRQTGQTERVSLDSQGVQGNHISYPPPSISGDGRFLVYRSTASNLVAGDTNNFSDVFVHDRQTGETNRISTDSQGTEANSHSGTPSISLDGRFIAFVSGADNLVSSDTSAFFDVFVHDRGSMVQSPVVTVNNIAPTPIITGAQATADEGGTISLGSTIIDPGTLDTHTLDWSVTKDGNPYAAGSGTTFDFTPDDNGTYVVTLTATDDDGGVGTATETIEVANVAPMFGATKILSPTGFGSFRDQAEPFGEIVATSGDGFFTDFLLVTNFPSLEVEDRGIVEFDLQSFSGTVESAVLELTLSRQEGDQSFGLDFGVFSYAGNGVVAFSDVSDFVAGSPAGTFTVTDQSVGTVISIDVTDALNALLDSGASHAGFNIRYLGPEAPLGRYVWFNGRNGIGAPSLRAELDPLTLSATEIDENGMVTLNGLFTELGSADTHEVVIDWGDGSANTLINLTGGERTFSSSHQYLDDGGYVINVEVTDDDQSVFQYETATQGDTSQSVGYAVRNDSFLGARFEVTAAVDIAEIGGRLNVFSGTLFGAVIALTGPDDLPDSNDLSTPDVLDTVLISDANSSGDLTVPLSLHLEPGWYAVMFGSGLFGANGFGNAPFNNADIGSPSYFTRGSDGQFYTDNLQNVRFVIQSELPSSTSANVTVNNVAPLPTITGVPATSNEGDTISLGSTIIDPGTLDTHTLDWSVTKDGNPYATGSGATFDFTPDDNGTYVVTLTATDDDGGVGTATETIEVANVAPALTNLAVNSSIDEKRHRDAYWRDPRPGDAGLLYGERRLGRWIGGRDVCLRAGGRDFDFDFNSMDYR